MATEKPVFVFAPGAWHDPGCFSLVQDKLHAQGYDTRGVTYPSVGAEPPTKGLADDAAALRAEIEALADKGRQVIVVVHSYGGLVGAEAVPNLGFKQRRAAGKAGGVTLLVYVTAFVTPKGASILSMLGGKPLGWMDVQVSKSNSAWLAKASRIQLPFGFVIGFLANALRRVSGYSPRTPRRFSTTMSLPTCRRMPWPTSSTSPPRCLATRSLISPGRIWTACTCSATTTKLSCPWSRSSWRNSWARLRSHGPARPPIHHFSRSRTTLWRACCMASRRSRRGCKFTRWDN